VVLSRVAATPPPGTAKVVAEEADVPPGSAGRAEEQGRPTTGEGQDEQGEDGKGAAIHVEAQCPVPSLHALTPACRTSPRAREHHVRRGLGRRP